MGNNELLISAEASSCQIFHAHSQLKIHDSDEDCRSGTGRLGVEMSIISFNE